MSKESSLDDLLDALQNFSEGSNPESLASDAPDQVENLNLSWISKLIFSKVNETEKSSQDLSNLTDFSLAYF